MNRVLERPEQGIGDDLAAAPPARRSSLRRRFTFVSVGLLSILLAVLGVNFAADTDTSNLTITSKGGLNVHAGTPQGWTVSVGSAGTVPTATTGQYIAAIDTKPIASSTKSVSISLYVTNMAELAANYSSWNFNIKLYTSPDTFVPAVTRDPDTLALPANTDWTKFTPSWTAVDGTLQVVTSDQGTLTWVVDLPADAPAIYAVRLDAGGSFYTIDTKVTEGVASLSPKFYVRATEL